MNVEEKDKKEESGEDIQEDASYSNSNFEEEEEDSDGSIAEEIEETD